MKRHTVETSSMTTRSDVEGRIAKQKEEKRQRNVRWME
jgi:hypothetical protein